MRLREPILSALITIASTVIAELEEGAQNATILVTDTERDLGGRLKDATEKARDDADAIAQLKQANAQLTRERDSATSRAVAAEAARDALLLNAKGIAELKADFRKALKTKATPAATAGRSRTQKAPRRRKAPTRR